ncbi:MAG: homocysteine S-methyltransferase [Candidatus Neomarinimicrobiota bacterium]
MTAKSPIQPFIDRQGFLLLDGGLATELENHGYNLDTPLWSAELLQSKPEAIKAVHLSYLEAGADCITAASYQASLPGFRQMGVDQRQAEMLLKKSVDLALKARSDYLDSLPKNANPSPLVAASVGPYSAYLANGTEYTGDYGLARSELRAFHERRFQLLAESGADLMACETIPSLEEATVLLELLEELPDAQAWFSFSCRDGHTIGDGTPIRECARLLKDSRQVLAVGVNCTAPQHISDLIDELTRIAPEKQLVVYPNSGEDYDSEKRRWSGRSDPRDFGAMAVRWYHQGARLLGGCCRTGPAHIKALRSALRKTINRD